MGQVHIIHIYLLEVKKYPRFLSQIKTNRIIVIMAKYFTGVKNHQQD